ncbi:MAG: hypothetical protein AB7D07_10390 [Desulfovibrionaceae bacterium]
MSDTTKSTDNGGVYDPMAPATSGQLEAMANLGIDFEQPLTKGEASRRIEGVTNVMEAQRLARAENRIALRRAALESVKLKQQIQSNGLDKEVEEEMAQIRSGYETAKRSTSRGR